MATRRNDVNRLGTRNVRGINETAKREEVVDVLRKGKSELLDLTETKFKGNGKVLWCKWYHCWCSGDEES